MDHPLVALPTPDPTSTTILTQPPASATARRLVSACRHHPLFDVGYDRENFAGNGETMPSVSDGRSARREPIAQWLQ